MVGMRRASRVGACALLLFTGLVARTAAAQDCVAPRVERALNSCEGFGAAAPSRPGRGGPAALPSAAPAPARDAATPPAPQLAPRPRRGAAELRQRQYRLLQTERRVLERLLVRTGAGDPQRADVLRRLAMTIGELMRQNEVRARSLDEPIFRARQAGDSSRAQRLWARQREAEAQVVEDREAAIRALAQLVAGFSDRSDADESLYTLALLLEEHGQAARARQVYHRLLREHPQSRYVPHAYLAFAEHSFGEGDLTAAAQLYERVLQVPAERNELYGYALYKLAWVRHNQEDFRGALDAFVRLLEHTRQFADRSDSAALARQTRRELVLPYAQTGRPDRALALFRRVAEHDDEAYAMLESLGQLYFDTGQWPETSRVHHQLMAELPGSDSLCRWQLRVLDATLASRPKDEQVREARRTVEVSQAFASGAHLAQNVTECREETATALLLLSTGWHREAVGTDDQPGTRDPATMQQASALYDLLGDAFPDLRQMRLSRIDRRDRPTAAQVAAYQGELLFELQRWAHCAAAFERALDLGPDAQLAADAAYGAVLCYDRHFGSREPPETPDDRVLTPRELTDEEQRMAHTFQRFACAAPQHEELPVVLYRWARLHFAANRLDEAAVLFRRVAIGHPGSEVGEYAANLYMDSVAALAQRRGRLACFATLEEDLGPIGRSYCDPPERHPEVCGVVERLGCELPAERVARSDGPPADQARTLVELVRERSCPDADRHLYNAALYFEQARLLGAAIRVRSVLVEQYPSSPLSRRAVFLVGANYHALAIYEQAADWYERYVEDAGECDPDDAPQPCPDASEGLRLAARFRLGLGQTDRAIEDAEAFQDRFARDHPAMAANVAFDIGRVFEDGPRAVAHYRDFLRRHGRHATPAQRAAAHVAIARGWIAQGRRDLATRELTAAVRLWERGAEEQLAGLDLPEAELGPQRVLLRDAVAEARFELAEARRLEFEALRFPTLRGRATLSRVGRWAAEELAPWVREKQRLIQAAEAAYAEVVPLGVPRWGIAAASRLGDMYLSLVEQVRGSPIPDVIASDDALLDEYLHALDEAVEEPSQVAVTRYESCLSTATSVRWFDERSRRCERMLHRLDAARYPIASELRGAPDYRLEVPPPLRPPRLSRDDG